MNWFLRKHDGTIYGPAPLPILRQWAVEGRIAPEDTIRAEGQPVWTSAPDFPDLEMDWMVALEDGSQYGPLNLLSLHDLVTDGSIPAQARITHKTTKETRTLPQAWRKQAEAREAPTPAKAEAQVLAAAAAPGEPAERRPPPAPAQAAAPAAAPAALPTGIVSPQARQEWKTLAENRDLLEKECLKWKKMYEDEHGGTNRRENALNDRVEELRRNELAVRHQLDQAQRKLSQLEGSYGRIKEALEADSGDARAAQLAAVMESYNDLSQHYDSLLQQLGGRSQEIQGLLQSRAETEKAAEEQIKRMEDIVRRERQEADNARRRVAEMEETHLQLVRSYRELNERFIRMRDQHGADRAAGNGQKAPPDRPK